MAGVAGALRRRFLRFRREIIVVAYAVRHPDTPWRLRVAGLGLILYLAMPVDLIPIFVPVAGLVDDLLVVPWGLGMVVRRLPAGARADAEASAARFIDRYVSQPLRFLLILLLTLLVVWAALLWLMWRALLA